MSVQYDMQRLMSLLSSVSGMAGKTLEQHGHDEGGRIGQELAAMADAGTPLTLIEAELASRGQMLAFEPIDLGPAIGGPVGQQTIGGVFAANLSGSRRVTAGAARDHLIGIKGVNGRAELFKSGGRVMKNVTGYDLARGLCGSWGTLGVLTEVTFKVLPWPEAAATLVFAGLTDELAVELMCAAMGTPYEVSGAVHLSAPLAERMTRDMQETFLDPANYRIFDFCNVSYAVRQLSTDLRMGVFMPCKLVIYQEREGGEASARADVQEPQRPTGRWRQERN